MVGFFETVFRGPDLLILVVAMAAIVWWRMRKSERR